MGNNYVVLDFETTNRDFGSPYEPGNSLLLACWNVGRDHRAARRTWDEGSIHVVGTNDLVTDPDLCQFERECALAAEAEDEAGAGHPDARIKYALR